ncbi:hypothetical protein ACFFWC_14830 [Plantactinospora siamensis]|uniref:Uncharacterized protein n=1 Tax=Plantactinospora siamensis TaxID=555372 RepID=A0ABV6P0X7_9ACTN
MTDNDPRVWRDEERLPLSELDQAIATSPGDGQVDDATGNDAGEESAFGHGPVATDEEHTSSTEPDAQDDSGRDPTDRDRPFRPSTTGRTGPH